MVAALRTHDSPGEQDASASGDLAEARKLGGEPTTVTGPCVLLVVSGESVVRAQDGDCARLGPGDLLTVTPGQRCRLSAPAAAAEVIHFQADPEWSLRALAFAGCAEAADLPPFAVDRAGSDSARRGARLLRELVALACSGRRGERLCVAARRLDLLALAFEARLAPLAGEARRASEQRRGIFRETVAALQRERLEELTLPVLATRLGCSARQVSRLFREELGTTFRDHVTALRLERAKQLLAETALPVIEVAGETGWSSLAHFNTVFRRRVGVTPSAFRRHQV